MGLFSRFCAQALRCTAEEALRRIRDTISFALAANRFNSTHHAR